MKQTGICPKCKTAAVLKIKAFKSTSTYYSRIQLNKWGTQVAHYDSYICPGCGFIEHYLDLEDKTWQKWLDKKVEEDSLDSDFV